MPFIALSSGVRSFYQSHRGGQAVNDLDPAKETIILLHAGYASSESWLPLIQHPKVCYLYNFITFDAKFHGQSTGPLKSDFSYLDAAQDLCEAMDKLQLPRSHFVAESHVGCRTAIHSALLRPGYCSSLMLISPGVVDEENEATRESIRELTDLIVETNRAFEAGQSNISFPLELQDAYVAYYFSDAVSSETAEQAKEHFNRMYAHMPAAQNVEIMDAYLGKRALPNIGEIKQPVLLIEGTKNQTYDASVAADAWKTAFTGSSNLEFQYIHGAPIRAAAVYPHLVTRFAAGWLAKNVARK